MPTTNNPQPKYPLPDTAEIPDRMPREALELRYSALMEAGLGPANSLNQAIQAVASQGYDEVPDQTEPTPKAPEDAPAPNPV